MRAALLLFTAFIIISILPIATCEEIKATEKNPILLNATDYYIKQGTTSAVRFVFYNMHPDIGRWILRVVDDNNMVCGDKVEGLPLCDSMMKAGYNTFPWESALGSTMSSAIKITTFNGTAGKEHHLLKIIVCPANLDTGGCAGDFFYAASARVWVTEKDVDPINPHDNFFMSLANKIDWRQLLAYASFFLALILGNYFILRQKRYKSK